ncbi:Calbindin-32, partial [Ophiophagus hannah]
MFFLNQVWAHIDDYGPGYPTKQAVVRPANLEGQEAEWVTQLHDKDAPELGNTDTFLQELRARFEDESQAQKVEAKIHEIRQKSHPARFSGLLGSCSTGRNDS